jgi:hypothetical protein
MPQLRFGTQGSTGLGDYPVYLHLEGFDYVVADRLWDREVALLEVVKLNRLLDEVGAVVTVRPSSIHLGSSRGEVSIGGVGLSCLPMLWGPTDDVRAYGRSLEWAATPSFLPRRSRFSVVELVHSPPWAFRLDGRSGDTHSAAAGYMGGEGPLWSTPEGAESALRAMCYQVAARGVVVDRTTDLFSVGVRSADGSREPLFGWRGWRTLSAALDVALDVWAAVEPYRAKGLVATRWERLEAV